MNGTYATTGSNTFAGIQTVNSNLIVTGSITAATLVVQTITSSVIYSSGSNVFGNNIANTQTFTGSLLLTGSATFNGALTAGTTILNGLLNVGNGSVSSAAVNINSNNSTAAYLYFNGAGVTNNHTAITGLEGASSNLKFYTANTVALSIASTGAATFSNTITAIRGTMNGTDGDYAFFINGGATAGSSFGLRINAGGNSSDYAIRVKNAAQTSDLFTLVGTGAATFTQTGGSFSITSDGQFISKQNLDVATAGGRFTGQSARGTLGIIQIEQATTSADGGKMTFDISPSGSTTPARILTIGNSGQFNHVATLSDWSYTMTNNNATSPNGILINYSGANKNNTSNQFIYCTDHFGATLRMEVRSNGGIGNYSGNNVNLASDRRLKRDIILLSSEWNNLKQIEVVNYKYNDSTDETALYGAIAQQVQEVYPDLVVVTRQATETEPEYYGLREQPFQWLTTKVLQEAMEKIEDLQAQINELKNK